VLRDVEHVVDALALEDARQVLLRPAADAGNARAVRGLKPTMRIAGFISFR